MEMPQDWIEPVDPDEEDDEEQEEDDYDPCFDDDLLDELGYEQDDNGEWHRDDS